MDRGVWQPTVHGVTGLDTTEGLSTARGGPGTRTTVAVECLLCRGHQGGLCAPRFTGIPCSRLLLCASSRGQEQGRVRAHRQQTDDFSNSQGPGHPMSHHSRAQRTTTHQPGSRDSLSGGLVTLQRSPLSFLTQNLCPAFLHQLLQACTSLGIWGWVTLQADECSENPAGAVFSQRQADIWGWTGVAHSCFCGRVCFQQLPAFGKRNGLTPRSEVKVKGSSF